MTGPRDAPSPRESTPTTGTTRRSVLALSAGALLAGCNLPGESTPTPEPLDREALGQIAAMEPPPVPARRLPVDVTERFHRRNRERIRAYLDDYETHRDALSEGDPTAYAESWASDAREWLREAGEVSSALAALFPYQRGRLRAAEAAGAALAAAGEIDRAAVRAGAGRWPARDAARDRLTAVREQFDYRARDPARAVVTFRAVEDHLHRADALVRGFEDPPAKGDESLNVGALVARQEGAVANCDVAAHLIDRQRAAAEDHRPLGSALATAVEDLQADLYRRVGDMEFYRETPGKHFDRSLPPTVAEVVTHSYDQVQRHLTLSSEPEDVGRHATALVELHRAMAALGAFERVREAVADGEYGALSVDSLRARKLDALAAIRRFRRRESHLVAVNAAADPAGPVAGIDSRLRRALDSPGEDPSVRETTRRAYRLYVQAATVLDALPAATDRFVAAVRAAGRGS